MKKLSVLSLTLALVLALSACGTPSAESSQGAPDGSAPGTESETPSEQQELVFGTATLTYAEFFSGDVSSTENLDAVSSATTSKYEIMSNMATDFVDETANADGYHITGVKNVNIAIPARDVEAYQACNDSFVLMEGEAPAQYKTVTMEGGRPVYSATQFNIADTVTDATAELQTGTVWGDYQINVTDGAVTHLRNTREDEGFDIGSGIQGIILETDSGLKVGMEHLQSIWVQPYEVSFNVPDDNTHNTHISGYADSVEAAEIAVLVLDDEAGVKSVETALQNYLSVRADSFEGYAPQQAAMVKDGLTASRGRYVALMICPNTASAKASFLTCFGEDADDLPAEESVTVSVEPENAESARSVSDGLYHSAAVLLAWQTGDDSSLSDADRDILQAVQNVIAQEIKDGMTDYEKELAIHDWITNWSSFSMSAFSHAPGSDGGTDSDTPYGVLLNRSGNCWGYASTFQLFMDLLDIECITVRGSPNSGGVEHAWNMVRLDGDWYCVDTAWDDPIGGRPGHSYFNRTSEQFRSSGIHHWDESAVPEAIGTRYAYGAG